MLRLFSILLSLAAGFFLFFVVFDRIILQMWKSRMKSIISYSAMVLCVVVPFVFGMTCPDNTCFSLPAAILLFLTGGEVFRHLRRRYFRHSKPDEILQLRKGIGSWNSNGSLVCRFYTAPFPELDTPFRIIHLSDFHLGGAVPESFYVECIQHVNDQHPDLIFLTGDIVNTPAAISRIEPVLKLFRPRIGCFAVLGNHDFYDGPEQIRSALERSGIRCLSADSAVIRIGEKRIHIVGDEAPWGKPFVPELLDSTALSIALTHTPDNVFRLSKAGFDMVFAGHLHGGQWRFPVLGHLVCPSIHGRLFDFGRFTVGKSLLFLTAGIGNVWIPLRISCPPEILCVDVISDKSAAPGFHRTGAAVKQTSEMLTGVS